MGRREGGREGEGGRSFLPVVGRTAAGTLLVLCRSKLVPKRLNILCVGECWASPSHTKTQQEARFACMLWIASWMMMVEGGREGWMRANRAGLLSKARQYIKSRQRRMARVCAWWVALCLFPSGIVTSPSKMSISVSGAKAIKNHHFASPPSPRPLLSSPLSKPHQQPPNAPTNTPTEAARRREGRGEPS